MKTTQHKLFAALMVLLIMLPVLQACGGQTINNPSATPNDTNPSALPTVVEETTSVPDVELAAMVYLDAWKNNEFSVMYAALTSLSLDAISYEEFETWHKNIILQGGFASIDYEILQSLTNPTTAQVAYRVTLTSTLVGEITRETMMHLSLENSRWKVSYDTALVLPELAGGNTLSMQPFTPTRGNIYDQTGQALAVNGDAIAVQVLPTYIGEDYNGDGLVSQLAALTGLNTSYLSAEIFDETAPFILPLAIVPADKFNERAPFLTDFFDVTRFDPYFTRLYYVGEAGAQMIGYTGRTSEEEALAAGLPIDAVIGKLGVEAWADQYLSGERGGELYVVSPEGARVTILAGRNAEPAQSVFLTLDRELQLAAQQALDGFTGAIVVMERDTGRVLAMASSPTFDPNSADLNSPVTQWLTYFPDNTGRFYNRATQGQYPPGSIFKVISMAAALETEAFEPNSFFECEHVWNKVGVDLYDWTFDKELPPSGTLTIEQGLMRSCNPWFYEIGLTLYVNGNGNAIATMARAFGLGSETGLGVLPEETGLITTPDTATTGDDPLFNAVQAAIGQSDILITPLQAAAYVAALGNGGTLFQPQLIEYIESTDGTQSMAFEPIVTNTLPVSEETLASVRKGMRMVINNARGTAYRTFANMSIAVYGKTGTAQNPGIDPHAWFIGFTNENRSNLPDIAIAVLIENVGDGSEFAAPMFKRVVEAYFFGAPQSRYPWETRIGVVNPDYFLPPTEDDEENN